MAFRPKIRGTTEQVFGIGLGKVDLSASAVSTPYTFRFPATAGTANYSLITDGSGNLSWAIANGTTATGILQGDGTTISAATTTGTGSVVLATSPTIATPAVTGDIQQNNAAYLRSKIAAGTSTRILGVNATDALYLGGIDAAVPALLMVAGAAGNEVARFTSAGLGIGMTPTNRLDIAHSVNAPARAQITNADINTGADARVVASNGASEVGLIMRGTGHAAAGTGLLYVTNANPLVISVNGAERARWDSSGRLLIGNTTGTALLTVGDATAGTKQAQILNATSLVALGVSGGSFGSYGTSLASGSVSTVFTSDNQPFAVFANSAQPLLLGTSAQERVRISDSGQLLIGTNAARTVGVTLKVQVEGTDSTSGLSVTRNTADTAGPNLRLFKTRGAAIGATTLVTSGDSLGQISWAGGDGATLIQAAEVRAEVDGTPGVNDMPGRLVFYTTPDGSATSLERVRINSAGDVGIGITPTVRFHVADNGNATTTVAAFYNLTAGTSSSALVAVGSDTGGLQLGVNSSTYTPTTSFGNANETFVRSNASGSGLYLNTGAAVPIRFGTNNAERMRIDASGNVGIGATPGANLDVVRAGTASATQLRLKNDTDAGYAIVQHIGSTFATASRQNNMELVTSGASADIAFLPNGTEAARIDTAGRLIVGSTAARSSQILGGAITTTHQISGTSTVSSGLSVYRWSGASGANAGVISMAKSRGTAENDYTIVGVADTLGYLSWCGADGSVMQEAARIIAQVDGAPGAGDMPGRLVFYTTADASSTPIERMRISADGNTTFGGTVGRIIEVAGGGTAGSVNTVNIESITSGSYSGLTIVRNDGTSAVLGSTINLARTRGTALGAVTAVTSGDTLGGIAFSGADGADIRTKAAEITCVVDGTPGANDMPGRLVFSTTADTAAVPTERMRIDSNGRLIHGGVASRAVSVLGSYSAQMQITGGSSSSSGVAAIRFAGANAAGAPAYALAKSRGSTDGDMTIVASGDTLGYIGWSGADGAAFQEAARIVAQVDGTPGVNDMPGRLVFYTTPDGSVTPAETMRLSGNGNLSLGPAMTTARRLTVGSDASTAEYIQVRTSITGGSGILFSDDPTGNLSQGGVLYDHTSDVITIRASSVAAITASSSTVAVTGALTVTGNVTVGDASTDLLVVQAGTALLPAIVPSGDANTGRWHPAADTIAWSTAGTEAVRIDSSQRLLVGVNANTSGGVLQLKSGITFPATQVASTDPNTLDDYEEGTFTPAFAATGATFSYASQVGVYTKIGRLVTGSLNITLNTTGNTLSANQLSITGMPFTSAAAGGPHVFTARWQFLTTAYLNMYGFLGNSSTTVFPHAMTVASSQSTSTMTANDLHATLGTSITMTFMYHI